jgi:hypothetical protein
MIRLGISYVLKPSIVFINIQWYMNVCSRWMDAVLVSLRIVTGGRFDKFIAKGTDETTMTLNTNSLTSSKIQHNTNSTIKPL